MKCCICNKDIEVKRDADGSVVWKGGNNALPLVEPTDTEHARCCDACDCLLVIPARMNLIKPEAVVFGKMLLLQRQNPPTFGGGEE